MKTKKTKKAAAKKVKSKGKSKTGKASATVSSPNKRKKKTPKIDAFENQLNTFFNYMFTELTSAIRTEMEPLKELTINLKIAVMQIGTEQRLMQLERALKDHETFLENTYKDEVHSSNGEDKIAPSSKELGLTEGSENE